MKKMESNGETSSSTHSLLPKEKNETSQSSKNGFSTIQGENAMSLFSKD